jgi:hypothetical protein
LPKTLCPEFTESLLKIWNEQGNHSLDRYQEKTANDESSSSSSSSSETESNVSTSSSAFSNATNTSRLEGDIQVDASPNERDSNLILRSSCLLKVPSQSFRIPNPLVDWVEPKQQQQQDELHVVDKTRNSVSMFGLPRTEEATYKSSILQSPGRLLKNKNWYEIYSDEKLWSLPKEVLVQMCRELGVLGVNEYNTAHTLLDKEELYNRVRSERNALKPKYYEKLKTLNDQERMMYETYSIGQIILSLHNLGLKHRGSKLILVKRLCEAQLYLREEELYVMIHHRKKLKMWCRILGVPFRGKSRLSMAKRLVRLRDMQFAICERLTLRGYYGRRRIQDAHTWEEQLNFYTLEDLRNIIRKFVPRKINSLWDGMKTQQLVRVIALNLKIELPEGPYYGLYR